MEKVTIRALILVVLLGFLGFATRPARAQTALQPTQIVIGAPGQANPGEQLTVQAVLADSQGHPISKAVIYFTTQAQFLGGQGDVVLAQAITNGKGQAAVQLVDHFSGTVAINAEFRGDAQYLPSNAAAQVSSTGDGQVYAEHVGVDLPGFNVPPAGPLRASLTSSGGLAGSIANLWPAMNGWPVAAVLLLVWSMYLLAVRFIFRLASSGRDRGDPSSTDTRRLP